MGLGRRATVALDYGVVSRRKDFDRSLFAWLLDGTKTCVSTAHLNDVDVYFACAFGPVENGTQRMVVIPGGWFATAEQAAQNVNQYRKRKGKK